MKPKPRRIQKLINAWAIKFPTEARFCGQRCGQMPFFFPTRAAARHYLKTASGWPDGTCVVRVQVTVTEQ